MTRAARKRGRSFQHTAEKNEREKALCNGWIRQQPAPNEGTEDCEEHLVLFTFDKSGNVALNFI